MKYDSFVLYKNHWLKDSNFLENFNKWEINESLKVALQKELNIIGINEKICPYCKKELKIFPKTKTKCKNCGNYIYKRSDLIDNFPVLLKEEELSKYENEKNKYFFIKKHCFGDYKNLLNIYPNKTFNEIYVINSFNKINNYKNKELWSYADYELLKLANFYIEIKDYKNALLKYLEMMYIGSCDYKSGISTYYKKGFQVSIENRGFYSNEYYKDDYMKEIREKKYNLLFSYNICFCIKELNINIINIKNLFLHLDFTKYKMPKTLKYVWNNILEDRFIYLSMNDWDSNIMLKYKKSSFIRKLSKFNPFS